MASRRENRERITGEIMAAGRAQLAEVGAAGLSLRSIARDIGMVSSAVYRYVASRDELLTRLIIEAYDDLGQAAEDAARAAIDTTDLERWVATARAIRSWSVDDPHRYLLLYGSPVPGYAAPDDTIVPGGRVILALVGVLGDAHAGGRLDPPRPGGIIDPSALAQLEQLAGVADPPIPPEVVLGFLAAWTQMFGMIGFEITGQTRNSVTDHPPIFEATTRLAARQIGLR